MSQKFTALMGAFLLTSSVGITTLSAKTPQKNQSKPFLIQGKLPHLSMMIKTLWDDADLALTPEQKEKLLQIRKETVSGAKSLAKQINPLEKKIVQASTNGATPASLKADVEKLASLRAHATMLHLECIFNTKAILSQDQLDIIE
jgi:hypothetical protein